MSESLLPVDRETSPYERRAPETGGRELVDVLLSERARGMDRRWWWPFARPVLNRMLGYAEACRLADAIAPRSGVGAMRFASEFMQLDVRPQGVERVPRDGPLMIVANHPTGIQDGVALDDAVRPVREDLVYFANADALRACARFDEILIPVEWQIHKRTRAKTRETLRLALSALQAERALVVFPAGRIAQKQPGGGYADPDWEETAVILARRHGVPVQPVHFAGRSSWLYYFFAQLSEPLRDMTLFHEMIEKRGKTYPLTFGPPIDPSRLSGDPGEVTRRLKTYVETELSTDPDREFGV